MSVLVGGDSATPKPDRYAGKKIWGVYVAGQAFHVWTKEEVAELAGYGIEGVLPIVVPPQNEKWWEENFGYATLEKLVREAIAWGLPEGSPICLDVEELQSAQMPSPSDVCHAWAVATRVHGMRTWTYGSGSFLAHDLWGFKWLAEWPEVTPLTPELPHGMTGWQYHGSDNGIDLDIFQEGHDFLSPALRVVTVPPSLGAVAPAEIVPESPAEPAEISADSESPSSGDATLPATATPPEAVSESAPSPVDAWLAWLSRVSALLDELHQLVSEAPKS